MMFLCAFGCCFFHVFLAECPLYASLKHVALVVFGYRTVNVCFMGIDCVLLVSAASVDQEIFRIFT